MKAVKFKLKLSQYFLKIVKTSVKDGIPNWTDTLPLTYPMAPTHLEES